MEPATYSQTNEFNGELLVSNHCFFLELKKKAGGGIAGGAGGSEGALGGVSGAVGGTLVLKVVLVKYRTAFFFVCINSTHKLFHMTVSHI